MTTPNDSTPAPANPRFGLPPSARPLVLADVGRDAYETEFLRLFAVRDAITAELWEMTQVLDGLDARDTGGRHA